MNPVLDQLQQQLTRSLSGLDADQTQLRPTGHPEKWSIQQIAEHLLLTYAATASALQARIVKGTPTQAKPSPYQYVGQFVVTTLGRFPEGRKAPAPVAPGPCDHPLCGAELTTIASERLATLDALTAQVQSLFGNKRAVNHMILGPLNAKQWCKFQLLHGVHHIKQIDAIRHAHRI
jgi:DinB superfamily